MVQTRAQAKAAAAKAAAAKAAAAKAAAAKAAEEVEEEAKEIYSSSEELDSFDDIRASNSLTNSEAILKDNEREKNRRNPDGNNIAITRAQSLEEKNQNTK